jgi:hypothetical protein
VISDTSGLSRNCYLCFRAIRPETLSRPHSVPIRIPLLRIFRDYFGREWEVYVRCVDPAESEPSDLPNPLLMLGSLEFDSGQERRRLTPLPPGWYVAPDELLSRWCEKAAAPVTRNA